MTDLAVLIEGRLNRKQMAAVFREKPPPSPLPVWVPGLRLQITATPCASTAASNSARTELTQPSVSRG